MSADCVCGLSSVSGRSRLHLLDLGSCETDISRTREGGGGQCLSLSALGNVILALANGAKHVPYRWGHSVDVFLMSPQPHAVLWETSL